MDHLPEWITAISTACGAGSVILLWRQVKADHERSRRESAISYLFEWSKQLTKSGSIARRLAETLNEQETKDLADEKTLTLPLKDKDLVLGCLAQAPEDGLKEENGRIVLGVKEVSEIRWQVVRYLNLLETLFTASRYNVADQKMLREQFRYLASPEKGHHLLKKFREALGGAKAFPAIAKFEQTLEEEQRIAIEGRGRVA